MRTFMDPESIERESMSIIENRLSGFSCSFEERQIIKRIIHTTVDVEFGKSTIFHPMAIEQGINAIRLGKNIITDVHMVKTGIREYDLLQFSAKVLCFLEKDKASISCEERLLPRAVLAIRRAIPYTKAGIIVIGNAPTALFETIDLIRNRIICPSLVIGVPVGFVGAKEAKEELIKTAVPYITHNSPKGGSAVASAIVNALIKLSVLSGKDDEKKD